MFEQIRSAVGALEAVARGLEPWRLDGHDAGGLVELAARGERICASIKALGARRFEETKVWREGGHRSAAHWVAETTGETVGAATRTLETARALEEFPETDAAFRAGRLSETQAAEITSTASADPGAEAALLEIAGSTSVKGLRDRCREVHAGAEADDQAWARRLHESRRAHRWIDPASTIAWKRAWRRMREPGSTRRVRPTSTASSEGRAAPGETNLARRTPRTRSLPWRAKGLVSPSKFASRSTARRWLAVTPRRGGGARSIGWGRCR
jgi:Domain of unknown function (DUF222)